MKRIITIALVLATVIPAPLAAADTGRSVGGSGRGVENKTTPPASKPRVPGDFPQKIIDAVRNAIHG